MIASPTTHQQIKIRYKKEENGFLKGKKKGKLLTSHRSTIYPCYVPILGDLIGAGRVRLTRRKTIKIISKTNAISKNF